VETPTLYYQVAFVQHTIEIVQLKDQIAKNV